MSAGGRPIPAAIERRYAAGSVLCRVGDGRGSIHEGGKFGSCPVAPAPGGWRQHGKSRRGDLMGRAGRGHVGRIARMGAVVLGCAALANCSANKVLSDKYSPRVVEEGQPVPKGGGVYRVGQPYTINGQTYCPTDSPSYRSEGIASWYGPDVHGRLTPNG